MRLAALIVACRLACAQAPDPAYEPLARAYDALRARDYESSVAAFLNAVEAAPNRASIRKDLAYTYLKIGENELAREQFQEAMHLDPKDDSVALEYGFLCYETKEPIQARRIFDRLRRSGNAVAEQAFRNIDTPLAEGIERWSEAIARGADNFGAHFELATLAEQRDELDLAAEHYLKAWRLQPDRRSVLVDLGRVWNALNRVEDANAAWLAASRSLESREAETARELLPDRYPFVPEFRRALALDAGNVELRRELGYLLLRMGQQPEAEQEFRTLTRTVPADLLSAAQLGFLLLGRGDRAAAMPLLERVLEGDDGTLANRVRAVLGLPQDLGSRPDPVPAGEAKIMAERSIRSGYLRDAVRYLQIAHEADPGDFRVMLQLGWTHNILHEDAQAIQWFAMARESPDRAIASEAGRAWKNLHPTRFRTTVWIYPIFSSRWDDLFSYGQVKTELCGRCPIRPYLSMRFVGDTRVTMGAMNPLYLSESSFIAAVGIATVPWHRITAWAEAGSAISYVRGHMLPDYRAGISTARTVGARFAGTSSGIFVDSETDGVFVSRFGNDFLVYQQTRAGYSLGWKGLRTQLYWNGNLTFDVQRQDWANFVETGPGVRIRVSPMPNSMFFTLNSMSGMYLRWPHARFADVRAGMWYAFTR